MESCIAILGHYWSLFANAKRADRSSLKSINVNKQSKSEPECTQLRGFRNCINCIWHFSCPGPVEVSTQTVDVIGVLEHSTNLTNLPSVLRFSIVLCRLVQSFTCRPPCYTKNFEKAHCRRLENYPTTRTLLYRRWKRRLGKLLCCHSHVRKANLL